MYPYLNLGSLHIGTFGLLLWLAAVCATVVMHKNFVRHNVDADALNTVAIVVLAGIAGAKLWHELQDPHALAIAWHQIFAQGNALMNFLHWFQAGFAWYGGLTASIVALMLIGRSVRFKGPSEDVPGPRVGALRMLDLAAPAAAMGYGVGRIGCLTSGDGDYGINTTLPWGVHMAPNALVPPNPPNALVQPTPLYEFFFAMLLFWFLWKLGEKHRPIGWMTGLYLVCSGIGRFLVEFVRINPRLYFGHTMSNAQVAALGSVLAGALVMIAAIKSNRRWSPPLVEAPSS